MFVAWLSRQYLSRELDATRLELTERRASYGLISQSAVPKGTFSTFWKSGMLLLTYLSSHSFLFL